MIESLEYPLNISYILRKKKSIKRELLQKKDLINKKIAILGGSTTSEVKNILELFLLKIGIKPNFYESEYNKFYEDALFGDKLRNFDPDIVYIHTTNVNITNYPNLEDDNDVIDKLLELELEKYKSIWTALSNYNCSIIQNNFDYTLDRGLGNLDIYNIHGKTNYINKLNTKFSEQADKINNLYISDINYLSSHIGLKEWFDPALWFQAKYAISLNSIPELAFNVSKIINSISGGVKKCLVLDLDNTCWGGVIGDDGLNGISIGTETAISEAFHSFQTYIKALKERGITLAICSKNEYTNAKEGFNHPDSVLSFDDFSSFKANWSQKPKNIVDIAKELNIGLDAMVFIDDNPAERDLVSSQLPNVSVPDIGNDVVDYIKHIDRNGYFEPITLSDDDINRNMYYKDNKERLAQEALFESYHDFLLSLKMTAEIQNFSLIYLDRITQLINKTNQFNLTTKRYSSNEIERISKDDDFIKIYGKLNDRYGENGIVSIIIGKLTGNLCHIDLWLMSCRVLKRDMEYAMLDELVKICLQKNVIEIIGYYNKSSKNTMVSKLYESLGFILIKRNKGHSVWKLNAQSYKNKNKIIGVINE